ncbi:hypothetical protein ACIGXM_23730 [Kitasatospora sp. NPDC052896]|uniref:hypothetical protein n=1 Tax=Kitasatospora sp. NPDC052896 TaxID=3364061 RepID=UPI0037C66C83
MSTPDGFPTIEQHQARLYRLEAERAIRSLADTLDLAGLPPLVGLEAFRITVTPAGAHVELGGCGARALQAISDYLAAHTRCLDRVIRGVTLPARLAELPTLPRELTE